MTPLQRELRGLFHLLRQARKCRGRAGDGPERHPADFGGEAAPVGPHRSGRCGRW
ncbi:hypothetical protein LKX83_26695 [Cohnella sp. REN36]|nr:hypothetical protein [Cohnella sp. REN36]